MSGNNYEELSWHVGHDVEVVSYGRNGTIYNVSVECNDCGMVLMSYDDPETTQTEESRPRMPSAAAGVKELARR
ncbi:MAG: hypothetical protein E4G90_04245 [Gemmatimonadales bacterium]|nr:MAG: hypothetical protein E4G90_04245 [Gemmatimonadales bacterium]